MGSKGEFSSLLSFDRLLRLDQYCLQSYNIASADTDTFLINGFGLNYNEICASNLVLVDLDGNKLSDDDFPINKAGFIIHSAIHQARPKDLHCVMHSHEVNSQTLAASKSKLIPLTQEGFNL